MNDRQKQLKAQYKEHKIIGGDIVLSIKKMGSFT